MEAKVVSICSSFKRGVAKKNVNSGFLKEGHGLVGDAHADRGEKEISILLSQFLEPVVRQLGTHPEPGSFAENLLVYGLDEEKVGVGTVLQIGEAMVEVEMIGKDPSKKHTYSFHGFSLLAEKGLFCRVVQSGWVKSYDSVLII
ncbi:MAG: MOSC domain-containing protein [Bacillota bacterium]|nr:MOSC domain-containing protein [Bacillota bacterium]